MLCVGSTGAKLALFFSFLPLEVEVRWAGGFFLHLEGKISVNSGLDFCCSVCLVVPPLVGCLFFPPQREELLLIFLKSV